MNNFKLYFLIGLSSLFNSAMARQDNVPVIGEKMPFFHLDNIKHFSAGNASLDDFKGKWLILDFWTMGCKACVQSFPKINQLQKDFDGQVTFLLIGKNDQRYNKHIEKMYDRYRQRFNLELASAFDSVLFQRFQITSVPHVVIVNPSGIVHAITSSININERSIGELIEGKNPYFLPKGSTSTSTSFSVNINRPLLTNGNGGDDRQFMFRSLLAKWERGSPILSFSKIEQYADSGYFQGTGLTLEKLYKLAYFGVPYWRVGSPLYGKVHPKLKIELSDTILFSEVSDLIRLDTGIFNYSLITPRIKASKDYFMSCMKNDLNNFFGYRAVIEERVVPCWVLSCPDSGKIDKVTDGEMVIKGGHDGYVLKKVPTSRLIKLLESYHYDYGPFFDNTNLEFTIGINLNAVMTDFNNLREQLDKNGFHLQQENRIMKVLVIRDEL